MRKGRVVGDRRRSIARGRARADRARRAAAVPPRVTRNQRAVGAVASSVGCHVTRDMWRLRSTQGIRPPVVTSDVTTRGFPRASVGVGRPCVPRRTIWSPQSRETTSIVHHMHSSPGTAPRKLRSFAPCTGRRRPRCRYPIYAPGDRSNRRRGQPAYSSGIRSGRRARVRSTARWRRQSATAP